MKQSAPIRFLVLLFGGWIGLRMSVVATSWWFATAPLDQPLDFALAPRAAIEPVLPAGPLVQDRARESRPIEGRTEIPAYPAVRGTRDRSRPFPDYGTARPQLNDGIGNGYAADRSTAALVEAPALDTALPSRRSPPIVPMPTISMHSRFSTSFWLLIRRDGANTLAPGSALSGSQAGGRIIYRLNNDVTRPISLTARFYVPLRRAAGAEAALGLDWQPRARIPVHLLAERRQRIGREGRSAFAATIYAGGSIAVGARWRLDGYAQAGIVGARSRNAFVDASTRLLRPFGPIEAGGGMWGAAQPGASRLDIGPQLTWPIRVRDHASLRLSAEYRFRIAGEARPASGPSLTLGVDF